MANIPDWQTQLRTARLVTINTNELLWGSEYSFEDTDEASTITSRAPSTIGPRPDTEPPTRLPSGGNSQSLNPANASFPRRSTRLTAESRRRSVTPRPSSILHHSTVDRVPRSPSRATSYSSTSSMGSTIHVRPLQVETAPASAPANGQEVQPQKSQLSTEAVDETAETGTSTSTPTSNRRRKEPAPNTQEHSNATPSTKQNLQPEASRTSGRQLRSSAGFNTRAITAVLADECDTGDETSLIGDNNTSDVDPDYGAKSGKRSRKGGGRPTSRKSGGQKK